jgi:hypothetical protein
MLLFNKCDLGINNKGQYIKHKQEAQVELFN